MPLDLDDLRELYQYWQALAADGFVHGYDPVKDLPHLAPRMMVVKVLSGEFRYDYFGHAIGAKLGDLAGRPIGTSTLVEPVKIGWHRLLTSVARRRTPRLIQITGAPGSDAHLLVLPLGGADGKTDRILAGVRFNRLASARIIINGWRSLDVKDL